MDLRLLQHRDRSVPDDSLRRRLTHEWSESVQVLDYDHEHYQTILSRLHDRIALFCHHVLLALDPKARQTKPMSKPLYRLLNSACTTFTTWGNDYGVAEGNLDDALKDSQDIRLLTITIMIRICETLTDDLLPAMLQVLKTIHPGETDNSPIQRLEQNAKDVRLVCDQATSCARQHPDADGLLKDTPESSSVGTENPSLEDVLENLMSDVEALVELGPCLEDPIRDTLVEKPAPPLQDIASSYQPFFEGIKQKFPHCDEGLAKALSQAIYDTTMRLHAERQIASAKPGNKPEVKDSGYETSLKGPSQDSGTFHESTIASGRSYARTLASYVDVGEDTAKTPFPSQPKHLAIGEEFPCPACGQLVAKSERGAAWKRHLLSDLRPWVCCQVSCDCSRVSYRTKDEWLRHLQAQHEVHPHWNDKKCPFCLHKVPAGGRDMIRHVEHHLRQLSLAALTASPEDDGGFSESEHSDGLSAQGHGEDISPDLKDHPLYRDAVQGDDGLWHCPWEGEGYCDHKPSVLRADFDDFIMSHLDSLRCKVEGCTMSGNAFATQEILHLHEQKEHGMHEGGGRFLCTSPGCGRSRPGNGFANRWVQVEHIKNVHENIPDLPPPRDDE